MLRKFVALGLVGLFLVMSLVVAEDGIGPYNPIADVNGDGIVDILDLTEVGQAYGSNYTLASEANRTVVTVVSFARDPPEVGGALVVINPTIPGHVTAAAITNSTGIAVFELSSNSTYTVRAFCGLATNAASFDTNSRGEASVLIVLGEPSGSIICNIGSDEVWVTMRDNATGEYYAKTSINWKVSVYMLFSDKLTINTQVDLFHADTPVFLWNPYVDPSDPWAYVANRYYMFQVFQEGTQKTYGVGYFQLDSDYSANAVVYGNSTMFP